MLRSVPVAGRRLEAAGQDDGEGPTDHGLGGVGETTLGGWCATRDHRRAGGRSGRLVGAGGGCGGTAGGVPGVALGRLSGSAGGLARPDRLGGCQAGVICQLPPMVRSPRRAMRA
jgi:hypothetical protein